MDLHIHVTSFSQPLLWLVAIALLIALVSPLSRALAFLLVSVVEHFRYSVALILLIGLMMGMGVWANG